MNRFSLILCSVGDFSYIDDLFKSLMQQSYKNFEVILVDQNDDDRLVSLISKYQHEFRIIHIKSERGLSLARNIGLGVVSGDIISFPDDDCKYQPDTLEKVNEFFIKKADYQGLVIRAENSVKSGRVMHANDASQDLDLKNALYLVHSISLFLSKKLISDVGEFDINLGLGAKTIYQGQEDRDYPIRALKKGFKIYFDRDITVLHPWDDPNIDQEKNLIDRAFKGASAEMYLLNKHGYSNFYKMTRLIRKLLAIFYFAVIKMNLYKARASISGFNGLLRSFNVKL